MTKIVWRVPFAAALAGIFASAAASTPDVVDSDVSRNTAMGSEALWEYTAEGLSGGARNTACGFASMYFNTTGSSNTACGYETLAYNSSGSFNTAEGNQALENNTTGFDNSAFGDNALLGDADAGNSGSYNAAFGNYALYSNKTGADNTAAGDSALYSNTTGGNNVATGAYALNGNTVGNSNTATGSYALDGNTTGGNNTASGSAALINNTTGNSNTAVGANSLGTTIGSNNIAIGYSAGAKLTTGHYNIDIGNEGGAVDTNEIRIGTAGQQHAAFIAGIENSRVTGAAVYVTAAGQLGVLASSERYKTAISPAGTTTAKLRELRPVSFHLKNDPAGAIQYGLIAEEVDQVYPELVIRDTAGNIQGVRYDELAPMLLNELQLQQRNSAAQDAEIRDLKARVAELDELMQATR